MKRILFALMAILGIVACEEGVQPVENTLILSVDNTEIYADGEQKATFTVKNDNGEIVNDATIHFNSTNEALEGNTFTTLYAGEYEFYASKGNTKSNIVKITAKEVTADTKVVTLSVAPETITADGVEKATFSVKCNGEEVTATIYNAADDTALQSNTFTTTTAGEYTFYAIYDEVRSNNVSLTATAKQEPQPDDKEVVLSVAPETITADGVEKATFTVTYDNEDVSTASEIFNAADDSKLDGVEFTTTTAGVYEFYAMYDGKKSNSVKLTVKMHIVEEEKPITIEATKTSIKANGIDSTSFTVMQDGSNITTTATIYVNGGILNGTKFSTTTPGTYTIYAEKGSVKSNELTITAEEVSGTGKSIIFAEGVTQTSGWYDVNKVGMGDNGDINMCWAAASSNMIQWFQDRYVAAGNTLPASAVTGPGKDGTYELALMDMYHSEWNNSRGGHMEEAIPWYFEGKLNGGENASPGSQATPLTDGGYWSSIWESEVLPHVYHGYSNIVVEGIIEYHNLYITKYNNYYLWGKGSSYQGNESLLIFSDYVVEAFKYGMAGLVINLSESFTAASHAVTLWGYEIDNTTGLVTRLWITDSDDLVSEPKEQLLNEYKVSIDSSSSVIKLTGDSRYGACYIMSIHPFAGYGSND